VLISTVVSRIKVAAVVAIYVGIAAFFYVVFAYFAGFSARQSIVLAVMSVLLKRAMESFVTESSQRFFPYRINVHPRWPKIFTDFKLIDQPEDWDVIGKFIDGLDPEYRGALSGVSLTVITQSEDFKSTLIFRSNSHVFESRVDFQGIVAPIKNARYPTGPLLFCDVVCFFMKSDARGYALGIKVPHWWWEEVRGTCPKPMEEERVYDTGTVKLTLAILSDREFDVYWQPVKQESWAALGGRTKRQNALRDDQRREFAWTQVRARGEGEPPVNWPESIEHKYFEVNHEEI